MSRRVAVAVSCALALVLVAEGFVYTAIVRGPLRQELLAAIVGRNSDGVRRILDRGADVNAREPASGMTAIMLAAAHGDDATLRLLLDRGADVNARSREGFTA